MSLHDKYSIVGLGVTPQGKVPGVSANGFRVQAIDMAIKDAGLRRQDVDGYIWQSDYVEGGGGRVPWQVGISPRFIWSFQTGGATAVSAMAAAMGAIEAGLANYVAVVFGDNAASKRRLVGAIGESARSTTAAFGMFGPAAEHALAATRHMQLYGTTSRQLGAIAVAARENANKRPNAMMHGKPMTIEDHQNSRMVVEPLRLFDCCLVTDGGIAYVITTSERANALKRAPIYVSGIGTGHNVNEAYTKSQFTRLDVTSSKERAFQMAGIELKDVDVAELYDCFTITVLLQLEGYGFCNEGEGGPFVEAGSIGLDSKIPVNTGGGNLSWAYGQGFTPLAEAIRQLRGEGGATQVKNAEIALVSGHGGTGSGNMHFSHATAILRRG